MIYAKFCVADGLFAYVGSANLRALGLGRHLEMVLLVQSKVVRQIEDFWIYAFEIKLFILVVRQNFTIEEWQKLMASPRWDVVPDFWESDLALILTLKKYRKIGWMTKDTCDRKQNAKPQGRWRL